MYLLVSDEAADFLLAALVGDWVYIDGGETFLRNDQVPYPDYVLRASADEISEVTVSDCRCSQFDSLA